MAWTTMHFAVGMGCAGAATGLACLALRRSFRWVPAAMTLGGVWALIPDMPRVFREDFPNAPFASLLGSHSFERWLHRGGDLFGFHLSLDIQPHAHALLGLALILLLYNLSIVMLMTMERRQRTGLMSRHWRAHGDVLRHRAAEPRPAPPSQPQPSDGAAAPDPAVLHRIGPTDDTRSAG